MDRISEVSDETYNAFRDILQLSTGQNAEILNLWINIGLSLKKSDIISYAKDFLSKNGRMKYIRPLYCAFYKYDKADALNTFATYKNIYHPIAVKLILQDFQKIGVKELKFLSEN